MASAADDKFIARPYQDELIEEALKRNIICVLGTGTGKTYIAVKVIQAMQHVLEKDLEHGGKRTVFLVPTVPLVEQQSGVILRHTGLNTGKYSSSEKIDNLSITDWRQSFRTNKVLVMVPDVLKDLLTKAFLEPKDINLLVLDECHHTAKDHPYREIMRLLFPHQDGPRVLGLTASGINISLKKPNVDIRVQLEESIKELEACLNCTVLTSLDVSLTDHGARPSPTVVTYETPANGNDQEVLDIIESIVNFLEHAKKQEFSSALGGPQSLSVSLLDNKYIKDSIKEIKNAISQVENTLSSMGPYCAYMTSRHLMKDWKSMLGRNMFHKQLCDLVCACICQLQLIGSLFEVGYDLGNVKEGCSEAVILHLITPKLKKLLTLLDPYLRSTTDSSQELCCIIFVEERYNAWALHQFLQLLRAAREGTYSKINSGFCVGQLDESGTEENTGDKMGLSFRQLQSTLKKFRSGEVNVLVATNVVEEGFDVRECNLIIRLNAPQTYRSYVQSKGRARAKNSKFLMMVAQDDEQTFRHGKLKQFETLDLILKEHCVGRNSPTEEERIAHFTEDVHVLCPPFQPPGSKACITLGSALKSLQTYCNTLPNDNMTTCMVWPKIEKRGDRGEQRICTLYLPLNAAIKEPVTGPVMETSVQAKKAAALICCRLLYDKGELSTEHLLPKDRELEWKDEIAKFVGYRDKETVGSGDAEPGTRRRLQLYPRNVPVNFAKMTPAVEAAYLYRIAWSSRSSSPSASQTALDEGFPIGFVSGSELAAVPAFPLYHELDVYQVHFQLVREFSLNAAQLKFLQNFHQCVFENVFLFDRSRLRFTPDALPDTVFIVPLTNDGRYSINWLVIQGLVLTGSFQMSMSMEASDRQKMEMNASQYRDAVVVTNYQKGEEPERYFVIDIPENLTPLTYTVKEGKSCQQYMVEKYHISLMHPHSPLLCVRHCPKSFDFVRPKPIETKNNSNRDIFLPMEFCHVLPISVQWYQSFRIVPYVLYRLRTFHNSFDLYRRIRTEVWNDHTLPGPWMPLQYDHQQPDTYVPPPPRSTSSSSFSSNGSGSAIRENGSAAESAVDEEPGLFSMKYESKLYYIKRNIKRNQPNTCSPSSPPIFSLQSLSVTDSAPSILEEPPQYFDREFSTTAVAPCPELTSFVKALTTAFAGDGFNMERLETIGDAFLKMITCVYLFMEYPQHHEGRLTAIKGIQVSNYNLYRLGKAKNLQNYVINVNVFADAKKLYLPPGFIPLERMDEIEEDDFHYKLPLRDKSLADVVEALIGMILLEGNARYAQQFMQWMGLKAIHPRGTIGSGSRGNVPGALLRTEDDPLYRDLSRLTAGFGDFERRIGYTFRDKSFLLQAFSHNSYFVNRLTDCYQRLEFVGDAVLDYLVTRHLYHANSRLSPGKLTDLRIALVNNKTFAKLAVKYGYHNCIKYSSTKIFGLIAQFVDEESENDPNVEPLSAEMFAGFDDDDEEDKNADVYEAAESPKVLGDVFESVAGAIFLDSGLSLDAVWKVYYSIMRKRIDFCLEHCPKNPKRELQEREPCNVTFLPPTVENNKVLAAVEVADKGVFHGKGNNVRAARSNASKVALKALYPGVLCD